MYEEGGFLVDERYSEWQKKKVRAIIVNGHSKHPTGKSLGAALQLAKPYDRIELVGGEYTENVSIQYPVEIVASEGEEPILVSRNTPITITANVEVYLENLTLVCKGKSKMEAAVVATAGKPVIFRCRLSTVSVGGTANIHMEHCTITRSSNGYGLLVQGSGGGMVKGTTIHTHSHACAAIDTRGELKIVACTLYTCITTGGNVMMISGSMSSTGQDVSYYSTACQQVEVKECQIYITSPLAGVEGADGVASTGALLHSLGVPSCVVISHGATPIFSMNELLEGEVGFFFEGAGAAQLRGNTIRCQRRCGIFVFVEEGFSLVGGKDCLRITGDNVLDRCCIGIDVQCHTDAIRSWAAEEYSTNPLSSEVCNVKHTFSWISAVSPGGSRQWEAQDGDQSFLLYGQIVNLAQLKYMMREIATLVLQAYPTSLQPHFGVATESGSLTAANGTVLNPFARLLKDTLDIHLTPNQSLSASEKMLHVRGNRGVDIVNTKFVNCTVCAIRFGRYAHGLVDQCVLEDCGSFSIVVDSAAHPIITGCRFVRSRGAGILMGNYANPLVIGNELVSGQMDGLSMTRLSQGLVLGNVIMGNGKAGIRIEEGSEVLICANDIIQNRKGGMHIENDGQPVVAFNRFTGNMVAQVSCVASTKVYIARNHITGGPNIGVHFGSCSGGVLLRNELDMNGDGVVVELDSDPYVAENTIFRTQSNGVLGRNNGLGTFVHNSIRDSGGANVLLKEGSNPVFRANVLQRASVGGVVVAEEGCGHFEHNQISECVIANVIVADLHSNPYFGRNTIFSSSFGCGVLCSRGGGGTFHSNVIHGNRLCGVYVMEAAHPTMTKNHFTREAVGIVVGNRGKGVFRHNVIDGCYGNGILTQLAGNPDFQNNTVLRCQLSGVLVGIEGSGLFCANEVQECDVGVQLGSACSPAELQLETEYVKPQSSLGNAGNRCVLSVMDVLQLTSRSTGAGSEGSPRKLAKEQFDRHSPISTARSTCVVQQNMIFRNKHAGVLIEAEAHGMLKDNDIYDNACYGVRVDVKYGTTRAHSLLQTGADPCSATSVTYTSGGSAVLNGNRIYNHTDANVFIADHRNNSIVFSENVLHNAPVGIYVTNNADLYRIEKNDIFNCDDGVFADSGGRCNFYGNRIHDCQHVGVYVSDQANPILDDGNIIERCGLCGILVDAGGKGHVRDTQVRHCTVGVIVFAGPTAPFHVSHKEVAQARMVTSTPTFENNVIEEHESHGIVVVNVINGCPLRATRDLQRTTLQGETEHFVPSLYHVVGGGASAAPGERMGPYFGQNKIRRNRLCGVYQERFQHWDFEALDHIHAERKAAWPKKIKNAYGGYEARLGTSIVFESDNHFEQRIAKQVSFVENTVTECSVGMVIGFGCHPFLLRNNIQRNVFFGLLLRFNSAAMVHGGNISDNGIAAIYTAKGAKGFVGGGTFTANNGFCRPSASLNQPRDLKECIFVRHFLKRGWDTLTHSNAPPTLIDGQKAFAPTVAAARSYEQVARLVEVYHYCLSGALRILCTLVSASSTGMALASRTVPSSLLCDTVSSCHVGGVAIPRYAPVCTADGGIGVWIEKGSMTTFQGNTIEHHSHMGVLHSKGIVSHSSALKKFLVDISPVVEDETLLATAEAPPLANPDPGVLFSNQPLCMSGVVAALLAASASDTFAGTDSFPPRPAYSSHPDGTTEKNPKTANLQAQDGMHPSLVKANVISHNEYGVCVELYHQLRAVIQTSHPPLIALYNVNKSRRTSSVPFSFANVSSCAPGSFSHEMGSSTTGIVSQEVEDLDMDDVPEREYTIAVEDNQIVSNTICGALCIHIVNVYGGSLLPTAATLTEAVSTAYEEVCAQLVLRKERTIPPPLCVLHPEPRKVGHAVLRGNTLHHNAERQIEVTSRYVAVAEDGANMLLQFDTLGSPRSSHYASRALFRIPLYAALTQLPPPGTFVLEKNIIRDVQRGLRVIGYVGNLSVRLHSNIFQKIKEEAVLIEGHLASCTVGRANIFEENHVDIRVTAGEANLGHTRDDQELYRMRSVRTRIFHNSFSSAQGVAVALENCLGAPPVLVYCNEFSKMSCGTVGVYLSGPHTGAELIRNTFSSSVTPLVIADKAGTEATLPVIVTENIFIRNYIGALVFGGAAPHFLRNSFDTNIRAGLEIIDVGTRPLVQDCFFHRHRRAECGRTDAKIPAIVPYATAEKVDHSQIAPENGTVTFTFTKAKIALVSENRNVLSARSDVLLPAALLICPQAGGVIDHCVFQDNDIGVDAVQETASTAFHVSGSPARFSNCLFSHHQVAAVLVRGMKSSTATDRDTGVSRPLDHDASAQIDSTTTFEDCHFVDNVSNSQCGDIISMGSAPLRFQRNVFFGTVHLKAGNIITLKENTFLPGRPVGGSRESTAADTAVIMHAESNGVVDHNTFYGHRIAVQTYPGAWGSVTGNWIVSAVVGVSVAPYCSTLFSLNRLWLATDCAMLVFGGVVTENDVYDCPVGIVVQCAAQFKGINSIPMHQRRGYDVLCTKNVIYGCGDSGIVVAGAGTFEGNTVFNCKKGINVVCPPESLTDITHPPHLKNNTILDNAMGVFLDDGSICHVQGNDIFDNTDVGVIVTTTAAGVMQDNHISSPKERGAVDIPTETQLRTSSNVIRNQFSPAYNKGLRAIRVKEWGTKTQGISKEVRALELILADLSDQWKEIEEFGISAYANLLEIYAQRREKNKSKRLSRGEAEGAHVLVPRPSVDTHGTLLAVAAAEEISITSPKAFQRASIGNKKGGRGVISAVKKAVQKTKASAEAATTGGVKDAAHSVLIHVFVESGGYTFAQSIGQTIARVLSAPPMSAMSMSTTITTSSAALNAFLEKHVPSIVIVVLDVQKVVFSSLEDGILGKLVTCMTTKPLRARRRGSTLLNLLFAVVPKTLAATLPPYIVVSGIEPSDSTQGGALQEFLTTSKTFYYDAGLEDALPCLQSAIADGIQEHRAKTEHHGSLTTLPLKGAPKPAVRGRQSFGQSHSIVSIDGETDPMMGRAERLGVQRDVLDSSGTYRSTSLSRDHISELLSKMTAEALGLTSPPKKSRASRQSSSVTGTERPRVAGSRAKSKRTSQVSQAEQESGAPVLKVSPSGGRRSTVVTATVGSRSRRTSADPKKSK